MSGRLPKFLVYLLSGILILTAFSQQRAFSAGTQVNVYFNGEQLRFEHGQPAVKDGRTLVPFRKLFETLGFTVEWNAVQQKATGTKEGVAIELTINQKTAKVNGDSVALDVPPQVVDGSTMVPLRFVSENSGYEVGFSSTGSVATITIGSGGPAGEGDGTSAPVPGGSDEEAEPYVVKGRVVDPDGKPVGGAEVWADNQLFYNSNLTVTTDANGYYRIELPNMATTWNMGGVYTVTIDGTEVDVRLEAVVDRPFAGNTGAVRDFVMDPEQEVGDVYIYMDLRSFERGYYENDLVLTFTPIVDGKEGTPITTKGYNYPGGWGVRLPLGTYKIAGVHESYKGKTTPLLVRVRWAPEYKESTEFVFEKIMSGVYRAEIEFEAPASAGDAEVNPDPYYGIGGQTVDPRFEDSANPPTEGIDEPVGTVYLYMDFEDSFNGYSEQDIVVTLTPLDSNGTAITKKGSVTDGDYKQSAEFTFAELFGDYTAELEFKVQ